MTHEIIFDVNHCAGATRNREFNLAYIHRIQYYINEVLRVKGYVYLNLIYEHLGAEWNPLWENTCYIYDEKDHRWITFDVNEFDVEENGFRITILY